MYTAPIIDTEGVHLPTYQDRLDAMVSSYQSIFGQEAGLEISSPDYQLLSVFARALDDLSQSVLVDFYSRNPRYANGTGLDLLMPLFGLHREGATYSTVLLTLSGTPGAVLPSAPEAMDDAGNIWRCRTAGITLNGEGSAVVEAVCGTPGAVAAAVGAVHRLVSPVPGLSAAVNRTAATPGREAESDASCRKRLRLAAAAPEMSTLEGLKASLRAVSGVQALEVYENDTDAADEHGIPGHSICVVAAGGLTTALAQIIFRKKAPGIGTHGTVSSNVRDTWGISHTVKLMRAVQTPVALSIELTPKEGFDSGVVERIKDAMAAQGEGMQIAQDLVVSTLYAAAYGAAGDGEPGFTISLLTATAQGVSTGDVLTAAWNQRYVIQRGMVQVLVRQDG